MKKDNKAPKKSPVKEKPKPSFKMRLFGTLLAMFFIGIAILAGWVLILFIRMPSLDSILKETRAPAIIFIDKDGYEIRSSNKIMGTPVSVQSLPPHVWQSVVAIEDKRFFNHGALDFRGTMRAILSNVRAHRAAAGGSSITQQTAKNIFLSGEKKLSRKVQELILAYWLENRFSKEQILDLYLNRVSLVGGLRGIDAAARQLFQTTANELTVAQSAQIAAMLKAPTTYSPLRNPEKNILRARAVLKEMVRQKYISLETAQAAAAQLRAAIPAPDTNSFRYWTDYITEEVESRLGIINSDLYVYTTIDSALQEQVADAAKAKVAENKDKNVGQAAVIALENTGAIRAMVGGTDYKSSQFNRAIAMRQPGSAFKPVVYLVALENGQTPDTMVNDSPFSIGDYEPKNYNSKYYGDISLATAFAKSVNSVPLRLAEKYSVGEVLKMAGRLGVGAKLRREYSTVLGASEMTLLDLTTIYAVIWNDGQSVRPFAIDKITKADGKVLYSRDPSESIQILNADTVVNMHKLLGDVIKPAGTGHRAAGADVLGGKTGTSNDNRDAWFIGAKKQDDSVLTIGVWVGNDDFTPMGDKITGGTVPAEIFKKSVGN